MRGRGVARMSTEIPATVNADAVTSWSDDVDVVVIGFGIGGGCAAVTAAAAGEWSRCVCVHRIHLMPLCSRIFSM